MIFGAKRTRFGAFSGFPAKGRKVNPRTEKSTRGQPRLLSVNESTSSPGSQAQENSGRLTKKPRSQGKSTMVNSEGQGQRRSQPCDSSTQASKSARSMLDMVWSPLVYSFPLFLIRFYPIALHLIPLAIGSNPTPS